VKRLTIAAAILAALGLVAVFLLLTGSTGELNSTASAFPTLTPDRSRITLIVAGDIACAPAAQTTATACHQRSTADMLGRSGLAAAADGAVLLGDIQYESGRTVDFGSFQSSWGSVLDGFGVPLFPTPGNHEWYDSDPAPAGCRLQDRDHNACGYEAFFGERAFTGDVADRWGNRGYRLDAKSGSHPLVLLLIDAGRCEHDPSACAPSSSAVTFLRSALSDPAFNPPGACVVVGWHQARWSDYGHGDVGVVDGLWTTLFQVPAAQRPDLVVNGHDHLYERMPRLGAEGRPDDDGIAQLIVGTGGREIAGVPYVGPAIGRAAYIDTEHFGVVSLSVDPADASMTTTFLTEGGDQVDPVTQDCRT
jgi:hypothetical protein